MVRGELASSEDFGSHLDASLRAIAQQATSEGVGQAMLDLLGESYFRRRAEQRRTESERTDVALEQREEQIERIDRAVEEAGDALIDVDELPDETMTAETMREAVYHLSSEPVLTLTDAEVLVRGDWITVGMVRVVVREVGAWWGEESSASAGPPASD